QRGQHAEVAHGAVTQGAVLGGGYEAGLPGCRGLDLPSVDARETPPRRLVVRAIYGIEDRIAEEDPGGPDPDSRVGYRVRRHDRSGAEAGRSGGVLPQSGAYPMDADRHQRARLSAPGTALVAVHRRSGQWRQDTPGGARRAGASPGHHDGAAGAGQGTAQVRPQAQRTARCRVLAEPARRTETETGEREAARADGQLRRADQILGTGTQLR